MVRLANSRRPLAATTGSPVMNAIADGPTRSSSNAAIARVLGGDPGRACSSPRSTSRFAELSRSSLSWATVSPRYSVSTAPELRNCSRARRRRLLCRLAPWLSFRGTWASGAGPHRGTRRNENAPAQAHGASTVGVDAALGHTCAGRPGSGLGAAVTQVRPAVFGRDAAYGSGSRARPNRTGLVVVARPLPRPAPPDQVRRVAAVRRRRRSLAGPVRVDLDAGAHRRRQGDLPEVAALGAGRLEPQHLVERGRVVLGQLLAR